ncbi:MAG: hypothetical protein Q8P80_05570 [Candidatus Levybacteria bacterium]|nr:hypothetical protein [Candidatus Levybacteria bacterium]
MNDQNTQQNNLTDDVQIRQQPQVVQSPVGSVKKELVEPIGQTEWVTPSETEPVLHAEVKEAGVEVVSEVPQITQEQIKVGIEPAKESVPVSTTPTAMSILKEIEAKDAQKKDTSNSISWFWALLLKIKKQLAVSPKVENI